MLSDFAAAMRDYREREHRLMQRVEGHQQMWEKTLSWIAQKAQEMGLKVTSGARPANDTREAAMGASTTKRYAPDNPYRRDERGGALMLGSDTCEPSGPGLLGADIDRIARAHFVAGRREAEKVARGEIEVMQGQLANAFDDGYAAGRIERARGLARNVRGQLMGVHFTLQTVEQLAATAPKVKRAQLIARTREELDHVMAFVDGALTGPGAAVLADDDVMDVGA